MTPRLTASSFPMLRWQPAKAMQTSTGRRLLTLLIIPVVPGLGTRGGGLAGVVCRGVGIGFLVEFFRIRHEQDVIAAVRLIPKVPEGGALLHIAGDVANDRKAPPIRHEFLDDLAANARVEPEEIVREPFHGNQDQTGFMLGSPRQSIRRHRGRSAVSSHPARTRARVCHADRRRLRSSYQVAFAALVPRASGTLYVRLTLLARAAVRMACGVGALT